MNITRKEFIGMIGIILLAPLLFISCDRIKKEPPKDIIAYVNDEPIYASDLNKSMALMARQDPSYAPSPADRQEQLDFIIDKKLIIQEAVKAGLAREEKFVDAIKAYWEQTLIRDFADRKSKEYRDTLAVSDQEIQQYYGNMDKVVTFILLKSKDKAFIEQATQKILAKEAVSLPWEKIGPVRFADISSPVLRQAFALEVGNARSYELAGEYYLVTVVQKEMVAVKPLETIRPQIEGEIKSVKGKALFEQWLASKREKANIKILAP